MSPATTTDWTTSKQHARQMYGVLNTAWWSAYTSKDPEAPTVERAIKSALAKLIAEAIEKFGAKSECYTCRLNSVFGGPSHNASSMCRSGKRDHCTCDACF